jgi:hypothetical protein
MRCQSWRSGECCCGPGVGCPASPLACPGERTDACPRRRSETGVTRRPRRTIRVIPRGPGQRRGSSAGDQRRAVGADARHAPTAAIGSPYLRAARSHVARTAWTNCRAVGGDQCDRPASPDLPQHVISNGLGQRRSCSQTQASSHELQFQKPERASEVTLVELGRRPRAAKIVKCIIWMVPPCTGTTNSAPAQQNACEA